MNLKPFRDYDSEPVTLIKNLVRSPEEAKEAQEAFAAYVAPTAAKIFAKMEIGRTICNPKALAKLKFADIDKLYMEPQKPREPKLIIFK